MYAKTVMKTAAVPNSNKANNTRCSVRLSALLLSPFPVVVLLFECVVAGEVVWFASVACGLEFSRCGWFVAVYTYLSNDWSYSYANARDEKIT
jgi:hypothetical protein